MSEVSARVAPVAVPARGTSPRTALGVWLDRGGVRGFGLAAPIPGYSPDSSDWAAALRRWLRDASNLVAVVDDRRAESRVALDELRALTAAGACAVDVAATDLRARERATSGSALLGASGPRDVAVNLLVDAGTTPSEALVRVRDAWAVGVRAYKLKLGHDVGATATLAAALRAEFGAELELRVDANARFSDGDEAARALSVFAAVDVAFCEQPVRPGALDTVPRAFPVPVALDESMAVEPDRALALEHPALVAVVLKPTTVGGPHRAVELGDVAAARGLGVVVTHAFEGAVGVAVGAAVAVALRAPPLACGLADAARVSRLAPTPCAPGLVVSPPPMGELEAP
ncbi:MAG: hypothetical protein H6700_00870 [Myxococcales bacterium]|nr:hypothetical protein [Myxococcales bacterium]MCB9530309.1 hypothetical protein [Myxococcales bacterium]